MVNGFFVICGELKIFQENVPDIVLGGGISWSEPYNDWLAVETRVFHGFEALEDTVVVETYGVVDIKRMRTPT